jgi:hypothetical protein
MPRSYEWLVLDTIVLQVRVDTLQTACKCTILVLRLLTQRICTPGTVHILLQILVLNVIIIMVLVPTESWQLVAANGAFKVRIGDPTAISPNITTLLLHTAAQDHPYNFHRISPLRSIHSSTRLLLLSITGAPLQPLFIAVTLHHRRSYWLFTYSDHTDLLYCKGHAYLRRPFFMI